MLHDVGNNRDCDVDVDHRNNTKTDTDEPLQCPANSKWCGAGAGYQPFAEFFPKFQAADALPSHVDPAD